MSSEHQAAEGRSLEASLARLPEVSAWARTLLARIDRIRPLPPGSTIADVGAAQGLFLIACVRQGYQAVGIEPWEAAREVADRLSKSLGLEVRILPGVAESLPLPSEQSDVVTANSVIEHVQDAQAAFNEAYRILRPGGVFWFRTASSLCPRQREIRGFPCFGWYPDRLKRRIMEWAKVHRPHLVGHTKAPAIHWFTPPKARRMLAQAGFRRVYDRWDLRLPSETGKKAALMLRAIHASRGARLLADMLVPGCAYAAVK